MVRALASRGENVMGLVAWGLLAMALALAGPAAAARQQATVDVTGEWSVMAMEGQTTMMSMEVVFAQEGNRISGTLNGPMGTTEVNGEIDGTEISFWIDVETPNGDTFDMVFTGTVKDNKTITGMMDAGGGEFRTEFKAERKER